MAAGWIPIFEDTPTKREIIAIASKTGRSRAEVLGLMISFWLWFQRESSGGALVDVHVDALVPHLGADCAFWSSVCDVGWIVDGNEGLSIPNADEWLSKGAKARLQKTKRQSDWRSGQAKTSTSASTSPSTHASTSASTTEQNNKRRIRTPLPPFDPNAIQLPKSLDTNEVRNALANWDAYRRESGKPLKSSRSIVALVNQYATLPASSLVAAIEHSIANGWQGVHAPKDQPNGKPVEFKQQVPTKEDLENWTP